LDNSICWPKGTLPGFVLMIANHTKIIGTSQVLVYISLRGSEIERCLILPHKEGFEAIKLIQRPINAQFH